MPFEIAKAKIAPGQYKGQLLRVESDPGGKFGPQRKWFFAVEVPAEDGSGTEIQEHMEFTSTNTGPGSKVYAFLKGLLGRELQAGEVIEEPTGKTVLLNFVQKPNGYSGIDSIVPIVEPVQTEAGIPR